MCGGEGGGGVGADSAHDMSSCFFYNFILPSQHASNITYINIYNILNHGLYLHAVFEFIGTYRGVGGSSSRENGTYRTCCTNSLGMYTSTGVSSFLDL